MLNGCQLIPIIPLKNTKLAKIQRFCMEMVAGNLQYGLAKALCDLSKNQSNVINPADKRGNMVVMDVSDYERMCLEMLRNRDYRPSQQIGSTSSTWSFLIW